MCRRRLPLTLTRKNAQTGRPEDLKDLKELPISKRLTTMTYRVVFLEAAIPLTKEYQKLPTGEIQKNNYPNVYQVTSHEEQFKDLKGLCALLKKHAAKGHCVIKGLLSRALTNESRAGTTDSNAPTRWALLDVDGAEFATPDEFMKAIGFPDVSYVVQYSASHHIYDKKLRCHIFVLLDREISAPALKQYLIGLNFSTQRLKDGLELTKTGMALKYTLDITTCQNDKLIYIAPPILKGVSDPLGANRISYVAKKKQVLVLPKNIPSIVVNRALVEDHITLLRDAAKLPKRKNVYKHINNIEVLHKPDQAVISGVKEDRGFVYFNLNGGDSWAYYHPSGNPDYIYNFKSEPTYVTKDLLPEYWEQINKQAKSAAAPPPMADATGVMHLAFLDRQSSGYWRGTYDTNTDILDIYSARNETQIRHFATANNLSIGEFIPEWDITFDPQNNKRVDVDARVVNMFQPTVFMQSKVKPVRTIPPTIEKIILHVVGGGKEEMEHLINWIAFIMQFKQMTRTGWVLHGTEGTGKGLLFNEILRPLFGAQQTAIRSMKTLAENYNDYVKNKFIVFIDEVQTSALRNQETIMAKLRNYMVEPMISIRQMFTNEYEVKNYSNWIFASNRPDPVSIPKDDRRFNVGMYQAKKLVISNAEVQRIPDELQQFYNYLMTWKVDESKAHTPLNNLDRQALIAVSESSIDSVANALVDGDFTFFLDHLPTGNIGQGDSVRELTESYRTVLTRCIDRSANNATCSISRDELFILFQYCVGDMPVSPNKFTSRLKHHRIRVHRVWIDGKSCQGYNTEWTALKNMTKPEILKTKEHVAGKSLMLKAVK